MIFTGFVLIAGGPDFAVPATDQADWLCKKEKCALPVIRTAAANARTVGAWEDMTPGETRPPGLERKRIMPAMRIDIGPERRMSRSEICF